MGCQNVVNSPYLPKSTHFAVWLCSFFHQRMVFISPSLKPGLVLQLAFTSRMWRKWQCASSEHIFQVALFVSLLSRKLSHLPWEQACASFADDERHLAEWPLSLHSPGNESWDMWVRPSWLRLLPAGPPADCRCISKPRWKPPNLVQISRTTQTICRLLSNNRCLLF